MKEKMAEASDIELVEKCLQGDNKAFDALVKRYELPMYRTAYGILNDSEAARDVTQAGFLKSWEKLKTYKPEYKFYSWLYRIIVHEALNHRRSQRKHEHLTLYQSKSINPDQELLKKEENEILFRAIDLLTTDYKVVIHLRHFEELSYQEIAAILDIEIKTVKSRLYSARMQLRDKLYNR